jgi:hypothetical protein
MLQTIEVQIDAKGHIHPSEPLPPLFQGRALLTLLEPVNHEAAFLSEQALATDWLKPEEDKAWQSEKPFDDLFGIIKATHSVSLEEIELINEYRI